MAEGEINLYKELDIVPKSNVEYSADFIKVSALIKKRAAKRGASTKAINNIMLGIVDMDAIAAASSVEPLAKLKMDLELLNESILDIFVICPEFTPERLVRLEEKNFSYDFELNKAIALLKSISVPKENENNEKKCQITAKIPTLKIIPFEGDPAQFLNFKQSFRNTFDKLDITSQEAFTYLKQHLRGNPAKQINSMLETNTSYEDAWAQLELCYASPGQIKFALIKNLLYGKMVQRTYASLHDFQVDMLSNVNLLRNQEITVNDIQLYIYYNRLSSELKDYLRSCGYKLHQSTDFLTAVQEATMTLADTELNSKTASSMICEQFSPKLSKKSFYSHGNAKENMSEFPHSVNVVARHRSSNDEKIFSCKLCNANGHSISRCPSFPTAKDKFEKLKGLSYCLRCTAKTHHAKNCKIELSPCSHCGLTNHLSFLCRKTSAPKELSSSAPREVVKPKITNTTCSVLNGPNSVGILPTLLLPIQDESAVRSNMFRCLLDSCSQDNYVSKKLVDELNLKTYRVNTPLVISGFNSKTQLDGYVKTNFWFNVKDRLEEVSAIILDVLPVSFRVPGLFDLGAYLESEGYDLADNFQSDIVNDIDILIGSPNLKDFGLKPLQINNGEVYSSEFGIVLKGLVADFLAPQDTYINFLSDDLIRPMKEDLVNDIADFSKLENLGIMDNDQFSKQDEKIISDFQNNFEIINRRVAVDIPWGDGKNAITPNFDYTYNRLISTVKKLKKEGIVEEYDNIFKQQLDEGVIEEVPLTDTLSKDAYFLPHLAVIRKEVKTTKVRIVLDPSGKRNSQDTSLNDAVLDCPSLLPLIAKILLRARIGKYLTIGDIKKAFLQIGLRNDFDRNMHRVLWLKDKERPVSKNNLICYRYMRVPFGNKSSPFLLQETVKYLCECQGTDTGKQLADGFYMDNLVINSESLENLMLSYRLANAYLKPHGFLLYEWASSCPDAEKYFESEGLLSSECKENTKLLGYLWDRLTDHIKLKPLKLNPKAVTKREILSSIQGVFDPLGLVAPVTFKFKMFMQKISITGQYDWDDEVDINLQKEWKLLASDALKLSDMDFARKVCDNSSLDFNSNILHIFCDASNQGYGVCCYLQNKSKCHLIYSKSRINPKSKKYSICQLELLAICLGVCVLSYLREIFSPNSDLFFRTVLWTDSSVAVNWIAQANPKMQSIFVRNRVLSVREAFKSLPFPIELRHIAGIHNPADLLTRGVSVKMFKKNLSFYLNGPEILSREDSWPAKVVVSTDDHGHLKSVINVVSGETVDDPNPIFDIGLFSSRQKILRITGYVLRFISNLKYFRTHTYNPDTSLSTGDMLEKIKKIPTAFHKVATDYWLRVVQGDCFSKDLENLKKIQNNEPVTDLTKLQSDLKLFLDPKGIIRTMGRYRYGGKLPYSVRYPVLLPANHQFSKLIMYECHHQNCHAGLAVTCNMLRQEFWIPQIRQAVKSILNSCVICKKFHAKSYNMPTIGPLPEEKFEYSRPFETTALDYTGPITLKTEDNEKTKAYLLLFTCFNTRFTSLHIVKDLTCKTFLRELYHLSLTYSLPKKLISDNQSTFKKANNFLSEWFKDQEVNNYFKANGIEWQFTAAYSPHTLGVAERMVGLVKKAIYIAMTHSNISESHFPTIVKEISYVVNSRPLTYVSSDDDPLSFDVITPHKLLFGQEVVKFNFLTNPTPSSESSDENFKLDSESSERDVILNSFKTHSTQSAIIQKRWREQYVIGLREREKKQHRLHTLPRIPRLGEICMLNENSPIPKYFWKLGMITELQPDPDGIIRHVRVRMTTGHVSRRHVCNLFPLEIAADIEPTADASDAEVEVVAQDLDKKDLTVSQGERLPDNQVTRPVRKAAERFRVNLREKISQGLFQ